MHEREAHEGAVMRARDKCEDSAALGDVEDPANLDNRAASEKDKISYRYRQILREPRTLQCHWSPFFGEGMQYVTKLTIADVALI